MRIKMKIVFKIIAAGRTYKDILRGIDIGKFSVSRKKISYISDTYVICVNITCKRLTAIGTVCYPAGIIFGFTDRVRKSFYPVIFKIPACRKRAVNAAGRSV